ncbi:ornithine cyclodeaminase family protein [Vibrio splendidus]|uniref:ornithine cyclodeaminase family protein n=1 Tax=Vibrio splendidus TaxID=29497 RepID=UPI000C86597E|nr:ornithine cyclodeaminase family protein [Vibrio splendidus]PMI54692.1 ornithine cyclodeaminase [Vibrio splendidus]PMI74507.1 ornithine cyclodeaminase [Vibrio splendidus]
MVYLEAAQVVESLSMSGLIHSMRKTYQEQATIPQRNVMPLEEGKYDAFALLPAWSESLITVKAFTYFPNNYLEGKDSLCSKIMAFNRADGEPLALLDGKALTYWRTAAASALAADYLAREDATTLIICGTGNLAPYIAWAYSAVRPIKQVLVWGRDKQKAVQTVDRIQSGSEYRAMPVGTRYTVNIIDSVDEHLAEADIISCVTGSKAPLFDGNQLKLGTHVDLIGNHDQDKRECDSETVARASVYVDSKINVLAEAGDLLIPIDEGIFSERDIKAELADLCSGRQLGRTSQQEITLFKSVGSALADLAGVTFVLQQTHVI